MDDGLNCIDVKSMSSTATLFLSSSSSPPLTPDSATKLSRVKGKKSKWTCSKNLPCKTVKLETRKVTSLVDRIDYCSERFSQPCVRSSSLPQPQQPQQPPPPTSSLSISSWHTMTSHSPLGHSKQSNQQISSQSQAKQQTHRQYQRSYSEDLKSSRILETGETTCCPTDAPTIAQALWRPLWPPGWRPRGSLSSSSNKCNTNTDSSTNSNSNSSSNSNNNNYNKRTTSIFSNNNKSDYHNITSNTGNTLKNIFKRPLIVMSEHREDHRSGSSGVSVADVSKSGTSNEEEISRQRTSTDSGIISGKGGGGATKEGINRSLSSVNENCCVSVNTASNLSSVSESCFNCTQQSKSSKQQQTSSQTSSPSTTAPNNRLITLSSGRLRLGPTSNDVTSSVEEYESMEAWLDEHPKFLCDYVIRKAPRSTIDAWILAHSIPHSGSSCGTATNSSASAPASGAATPVRKISAHEFEKGSLFLPPMVSTTEEGIPTFLQPPTRDDYHPSSHYSPHSPHQQQSFLNSNLSTSDYSYLSSSSLGPSLTLRQPLTSLSSPTSSSISSSSVCAATAETAALLQATSSTAATPLTSSSSPLTDISFPSSSVQRTRSQFDGLDEKQLIFELVKDICNDLDVVSLNLKILKNVSLLTNADRCSLFLVKGEPGDPNRHFVPTLFDVSSKQPSTSSTATTTDTTIKLESIKVPWGQGIVGYVAESGESVIIDDCYKDSRFSDLVDQMTGFKTRNMLCSPIFDNFGQVMGVAQVINKLPRNRLSIPSSSFSTHTINNNNQISSYHNNSNNVNTNNFVSNDHNINNNNVSTVSFTLDDQRIFNQYLQFCGIGLRNAQLFERSQLENKRNQVLLDLARMVFEEQSTIEQIVYRIIVHLQSLLGCERCQVLLVSESDSQDLFNDQTDNGDIEISPIWSQYECDQHESRDGPVIGDSNSRTFSRVFDLSMDDLKESESNNVSNIEGSDSNNNKANEGKEVDPVSTTANSHSSNFAAHPFENRFPINIGITGYVAATGETLNIPNAYQDARFDTSVDAFDPRGFVHKSILCMPIRNANRRIIGVSQLVNKLNGQPFNKNDENLFEAFAIFCGMGIHNTQMYEKAMKAMAKQRVTFECLSYHATARREEATLLSREPIPSTQALRLACLDFHDFSLETDDKMVKACIRMFLDLDLINRFSIDYLTLCRWLLSVRKNYRPVTYHNWRHAFNVAQMMFSILVSTTLCTSLGELDTLALIMACLCHDLDHRGTNNSFQIKSSSPLATLYSTSTMEHHHFDQSLMILNSEGNQILSNLSPAEYKRVVRVMEEAILATDLVVYFTNREAFFRLIESGDYHWDSNELDKKLLRGMLMTACDIAAITKPWEVQKVVAELVATEFFQQGDIEKEKLNLQPIDMMNREKKDELPRLQVAFIDSICLPIFSAFASLYPESLGSLERGVVENKRQWLCQALGHPSLRDWAMEELGNMSSSVTPFIKSFT